MTTTLRFCNVTVHDVDQAIAFYGAGLGLEILNDVPAGEFRWVTLGNPGSDGAQIVVSTPYAGRSKEEGDALAELMTKGSLPMLVFVVDDLDAVFEKLRASGAEVLQEPTDQPWGPRDAAFRDPSGNTVRINQA